MIEVLGFSVAMKAMDTACKHAEIEIKGIDCNNPVEGDAAKIPVVIQVKFSGDISQVQEALNQAKREALNYLDEKDINVKMIPSYSPEIEPLLMAGKVKNKRPV